tara:strand:- start:2254 stop:2688 length:435 start_codon:yes stop_codon:yes gene_type:complete
VGYYSGADGEMKVGGVQVARVTTFSFTSNQETLDVTSLGDRDRKLVGGIRSISGSASIAYYSAASGATTGDLMASTLMNNLIKTDGSTSDTVTLSLGINDHSGTYKDITMTVVLTSIAVSSAQGEIFSADISFEAADAPSGFDL